MKVKHHAEYLLPGSFLSEEDSRVLPERTITAALEAAPANAFAFQFYDTAIVDFEFDAGLFHVFPIAQNKGPKHYIGGEVFTPDELRALAVKEGDSEKYRTLIANIEGNGWGRAIRCRTGNWQPFEEDDVLVEPSAPISRKAE